ncbi:hypothetical protein [Ruegeria sp.]|uniref:hypothetical protein n=1 Tax=Ruegeria sp. TaxID=1879320 RepID=UPI003B00C3DD
MKTERRQPWLPGLTPPPRMRRVMMHADDRGQAPGLMPGWRTAKGWLFDMTDSEVRRGVPCPVCNVKCGAVCPVRSATIPHRPRV